MNAFQEKCWLRCELLLREKNTLFAGPLRVDGRRETYFIIQFSWGADAIELFIYANEAGVMVNGKDWTIFEAPDFDSDELLIAAYAQHLAELLKAR